MALDAKGVAALALHRFGLGPRAGSINAIASDPRGALIAEIERPEAGRIADPTLQSAAESSRQVFEFNAERTAQQRVERARREAEQKTAAADGMEKPPEATPPNPLPAGKPARPVEPPLPQKLFEREALARVNAAVGADIGFAERLVWFWSNHFCISADKVFAMAGGYEREAIRPHSLARFGDILLAAEGHPAMLFYLDNAQSIGPNSTGGINQTRGLNENLAREILELHTLGVASGYTQDDVTTFAKVLTGWSIIPSGPDPERGGEFVFIKRTHEPGPLTVLGKTYPDTGLQQGRAVLADLARHPATATHVATKLARHFVADQPPQPLVDRLAKTFRDTGGDLREVAKALVTSPDAWSSEQSKIKRPSEWVVAILRASGLDPDIRRVLGAQTLLGEPLWRPPAPKGFADDNGAWTDGLAQRLDMANQLATRVAGKVDPQEFLDNRARLARVGRNAPHRRARRQPRPGAHARADGARIPEEMTMATLHSPTRRSLLLGSGTLFAWAYLPKLALAEGRDPRMLTIILRGALDGLAAVAPVGDPEWVKLRGDRAMTLDGKTPALPLDSFFALNPAMPNLHRMYQAKQAIIVHAAATPYRERSHFDGQDVLESGISKPGATDSGWLNRALAATEPTFRAVPSRREAFAVGPVTPLVVRGAAPILSWTPPRLAPASDDTIMRLLDLYQHTDPALARVLEERMGADRDRPAPAAWTRRRPRCRPVPIACAPISRRRPARRRNSSRVPTDRASARWHLTAGTRMSTRAPTRGASPRCSVRSMPPSRRWKPTWAMRGARRW